MVKIKLAGKGEGGQDNTICPAMHKCGRGTNKNVNREVEIPITDFSYHICRHYRIPKRGLWKFLKLLDTLGIIICYSHRKVTLSEEAYEILFDKKGGGG